MAPTPPSEAQDDTRADGMTGKEIFDLLTGGHGSGSLSRAADAAAQAAGRYSRVEDALSRISASLGENWTGSAADAAGQALTPINKAMRDLQETLPRFNHSVANQSYQYDFNREQLRDMPAEPPTKSVWDHVTPWDTDTEDAINSYHACEAENRRVYTEYQATSRVNRSELPAPIAGTTAQGVDSQAVDTTYQSGQVPGIPRDGVDYGQPGDDGRPPAHGQYATPSSQGQNPVAPVPGASSTTVPAAAPGDPGAEHAGPRTSSAPPTPSEPQGGQSTPRTSGTTAPSGFTPSASSTAHSVIGTSPTPYSRTTGQPGTGRHDASSGAGKAFGGGPGDGPLPAGPRSGVLGAQTEVGRSGSGAGAVRNMPLPQGFGGSPMAPVGRADQHEDSEHGTPEYLVTEEHGNDIVGPLPMPAPPVLGG